MKRILLTAVISLVIGSMVYAQDATAQSGAAATAQSTATTPTASQTKQSAQQLLDQTNTNTTQYQSTLADFKTQNLSNSDAATLNRLQHDLTTIEANIASQEQVVKTSLDKGTTVNDQVFLQLQQLIGQHQAKAKELQDFIQSIQTN